MRLKELHRKERARDERKGLILRLVENVPVTERRYFTYYHPRNGAPVFQKNPRDARRLNRPMAEKRKTKIEKGPYEVKVCDRIEEIAEFERADGRTD